MQAKEAEAEQAGPLATAIARQKVTEQETRIDQVRKQQEVLVQAQEAARREQELQATVVKPAEAERQAAILRAEGEKQATVIRAEATQKELEFEGAGEAAKIERIGRAEAAKVLAVGEAEAEVIKKKLLAEAEGLQRRRPRRGRTSTTRPSSTWSSTRCRSSPRPSPPSSPASTRSTSSKWATALDRLGGVGKVMGTVGGGMTAMLSMLKDQFGVDIARLMEAKTEAAAIEAEKRAGKRPAVTPPSKEA